MAQRINRLTAVSARTQAKPGYHADGAGLYLQVQPSGSKSWVFCFMRNGKSREMGLGKMTEVSLQQAREKAAQCRQQLREGLDPIDARDAILRAQEVTDARGMTFAECAEAYITAHRVSWRNPKHAEQWTATIDTYTRPVFGALPVQVVDTTLVMKVLDPLWGTKTETASRLRGRIENILDWATVRKFRTGENPARWRGHLDKLLPKRSKVQRVKHHAALPYADVGAFLKALRERQGVAPKALEFIILTACRAGEALGSPGREAGKGAMRAATWSEIDFGAKVWTIPPERMKAAREHRVPLSDAALRVLKALKAEKQNDYVFPGWKTDTPLTIAAPLLLLQTDMGYASLTVHGFRSSFRDWAAEQTNFPREIAEAALAHTLRDKTEAAYQRGDLLERRREMMQAWAAYCGRVRKA